MKTELKFVHIGMGNVVCANKVVAIILPQTQTGIRYRTHAKEKGEYIDSCLGRKLKSLMLLEDGMVMGSAIKAKTLMRRLNGENIPDEATDIDPDEIEENDEE